MLEIFDDKSQYCVPFILNQLKEHQAHHRHDPNPPPFFLGLNGVQGAGKTVLVSTIQKTLCSAPHHLPTITLSLDDIYLTHADQVALAASHPNNPLLQHRGQPSTHDLALGEKTFASLRANRLTAIPRYDKSAFCGQGDRVPEEQWDMANREGERTVKVVIFEGWSVGFCAVDEATLRQKWEAASRLKDQCDYNGRLAYVKLEDVRTVNEALKHYDVLTNQLDALIHLDAQNLHFVYDWRQEQERTLRATKATGMTEEQVDQFVDGYYPSYELFTDTLREGIFKPTSTRSIFDVDWKGRQLRLVVDRNRRVQQVFTI